MKIFRWILWIIITLYVRIWIINNSFKKHKTTKKNTILIFVLSIISVSILYFYKDILGLIGIQNLYFSDNLSNMSICLFVFYCLSFLILLSLRTKNFKNKNNRKFIVTAILLFVWIGMGWVITWINTMIMYYLISCYAEEILKFAVWENILMSQKWENIVWKTDLILFAIMAGLGFSVIENIFYLIVLALGNQWNLITTMWRSIFTTLLHIVATGLIAFFVVKKDKKYRLKCLIWIVCGFGLHWLYNLCLAYWYKVFTILILIVCYFILSYLLFNSDAIYQKK